MSVAVHGQQQEGAQYVVISLLFRLESLPIANVIGEQLKMAVKVVG